MSFRTKIQKFETYSGAERERYRNLGYWKDESFQDFFIDRTTRFSHNVAVVGRNTNGQQVRWSYQELAAQSEAAARRLAALGINYDDRVVIALPNIVEYIAVVSGLFKLGAIPVFALPSHRETELSHFCSQTDAAALIITSDYRHVDFASVYANVADRVVSQGLEAPMLIDVKLWLSQSHDFPGVSFQQKHSEELAFLQISGGTTGIPKLIPRMAADYLYSVRESSRICDLSSSSVMLIPLPAAHNFPMSSPGILGTLHVGGTVVLAEDPSPQTAFKLIEDEKVTITALVPPLAQAWISSARRRSPDLTSLRTIQVGGAKLSPVVAEQVQPVLGGRLQQVFGMAEGLVNYTRSEDNLDLVIGTQGRPISPADEVSIVDDDDLPVPDGVEGNLLVRGPYTIRGYYNSRNCNSSIQDDFTKEGFYRTGDVVRRMPSGHLVVTGRQKEQVNRSGEKIDVNEIEGLLLARPDIFEAVAVGVADDRLGERLVVVIKLEQGYSQPKDLRTFLRSSGIAAYKIPDDFEYVDELPYTHVGKNSRKDLRKLLAFQVS